MVYKNESKDKVLNETITFTLEGLTIDGNNPNDNVVQFSLAPQNEKVVKLSTLTGGFSFGMGTSYNIGTKNDMSK